MAEEIKFVVVGHHTRTGQAQRLAALLDAHLLIDDGNHGANWNHRRALEWAACQPCRVVYWKMTLCLLRDLPSW